MAADVDQRGDDKDGEVGEATGSGTLAASPHALASPSQATVVLPTSLATGTAGAGSVAQPTSTLQPVYTAAEALDRSDLPRMRVFHRFGIAAPLGAIALSLLIGGDPFALHLFWAGSIVLSLGNCGLVWLARSPATWKPKPIGILWMVSTCGTIPMLYYFGPFSAVVMVLLLGIVFIALGKSHWTSFAITSICLVGHLGLAVPMMFGWIRDVGVVTSGLAGRFQLAVAEALICTLIFSAHALGRWARHTNATALAELRSAMRVIGDQQQALAEVKDEAEAARKAGVNEGRWTGHTMGSFKLGLVLGRGAMGEVYEGYDASGRVAAVKLLNAHGAASPSLVDRFHREMQVAAKLESPNIVKVFELSPPDSTLPFIAMEKLVGTDLAARLRTEVRIPADELAVLLEQIARGLEVARVAGVVHRDLKPHNLFFDQGVWKILDFGVSQLAGSEGTLTGEGIVGTPQYMAPEQARGGQVTHLADVYALGAIAYRCLTGRTPFRGNDLSELVYQVVHAAPPRPGTLARVSTAVEDVLAIAMAKDPRRRFPSALAFAKAFASVRRGQMLAMAAPPDAWT